MYKLDYSVEKLIAFSCIIMGVVALIGLIALISLCPGQIKYIGICTLLILASIIGVIAVVKFYKDKMWLAQNGKIARNLPFKVEKVYDVLKPGRTYNCIKVKYNVSYNREVEFTKNISKIYKIPDKAIDVVYDEKNPEYTYYMGFDIEEIKETKE